VGGTSANMITKSIKSKLFATTSRRRQHRNNWYLCTHSHDKKGLSETSRPGLITVMRSDHPKSYHSVWEGGVARHDARPQTSGCQLDGLLSKPILKGYGSDCNIGSVHSPHKGCLMKAFKLRNDEGRDLLLLRLRPTSCVHHEPLDDPVTEM
jgi:hypothetical protein